MAFPPDISVIIPTYNRVEILESALDSLATNIRYMGTINFWVGVDNDNESAQEVAEQVGHSVGVKINAIDGPRRTGAVSGGSLGANLNRLLQHSQDDLFLQMDDDHLLTRILDLGPHVEKLLDDPKAGWIRLMGVGSHRYCGCLEGNYWRINWDSPELYIPSNRPHLKHRRFHRVFGMYPEGLLLGATEEGFCHQCKDKANELLKGAGYEAPSVLVPITVLTEGTWDHVGQSWQSKGF